MTASRPALRVLLTGASSGIGAAMAQLIVADLAAIGELGALILVARRADLLESLATKLRAVAPASEILVLPCDLTDTNALSALIAQVGQVDLLINNAGLGDVALLDRADANKLTRMITLNVIAPTTLTRALLPTMIARGYGGVLFISSGFGVTVMPAVAAYAGTKHYISAFAECLRLECAGTGVTITQSCPGPVATEFEANAGNPTGMAVPALIELSAERCARQSWRAFRAGRARVFPGWVAATVIALGRLTPAPVLRLVIYPAARWLRQRPISA